MRAAIGVLLLLAAIVPPVARDAAAERARFSIGVMRRDGILIPFANLDGSTWSARWPTPFSEVDVPISLASVPKSWWGKEGADAPWTFWPLEGSSRGLRLLRPSIYDTHCVWNVGLKTDYEAPQMVPPPTVHHHPKDGVALTGGVTIDRIEVLDESAPEWRTFLEQARDPILKAGSRILGGWGWVWTSLVEARDYRFAPLVLDVLCRGRGADGSPVYYFEAVQKFRQRSRLDLQGDGEVRLYTQGFLFPSRKAVVTLQQGDPFAVYMLPFGQFRLNSKVYWLAQLSATGREAYVIYEFDRDNVRIVVNVPGGGC